MSVFLLPGPFSSLSFATSFLGLDFAFAAFDGTGRLFNRDGVFRTSTGTGGYFFSLCHHGCNRAGYRDVGFVDFASLRSRLHHKLHYLH